MIFSKPFHSFFIMIALSFVFLACKREEAFTLNLQNGEATTPALKTADDDTGANSAAAHIAASEKLLIPEIVAVPADQPSGNRRVATYYAIGVQKYKARVKAGSDPVSYEWVFVAPQADLFDATNALVGVHGAGPFWTLSIADSIFAQHFVPARTAPSPDAGSIDWLLLLPKSGTTPTGLFADVDYIQRIATKGGKAPSTPPSSANETIDVKYKAVYRFTARNP